MLGNNFKFLVLIVGAIVLVTGVAQSAHAGFDSDITAGPAETDDIAETEFFVIDGADFFVVQNFDGGGEGGFSGDPFIVDFNENVGPWHKYFTLCTPNGGTCDDHTVNAGQDITITEFIEVIGDTPFTDWHEEIVDTADWEWVADTVTVQIFTPLEEFITLDSVNDPDNIMIQDGKSLWIFFDEPLEAGTEITIIKEIENISGEDIAGQTILIKQYPSTEPIVMGPGIWGIKFSDDNGNGIQDGNEAGIPGIQICIQGEGLDGGFGELPALLGFTIIQKAFAGEPGGFGEFCVFTDANGSFHFEDLPFGEYLVYELPNPVLVNTTPMQLNVELTAENPSAMIEFGNQFPPTIPGEVSITGLSNFEINGMGVVYWRSSIMIEKNVEGFHCQDGSSPLAGKVVMGPFAETPAIPPVEVMLTNTVDEIWKATIPPVFPAHGVAPIIFYFDCAPDTPNFPENINNNALEDEFQIAGSVYIDPSGIIQDACTDDPIAGATVTVYQSNDDFIFTKSLNETPPLLPPMNDQVTLDDGMYGWVVQAGKFYRVIVNHPDYQSQTSTSQFVGPPAVFDFALLPNGILSVAECPIDTQVGGEFIPINTTALLLAGAQGTASWLIPVLVSAIGIGIVLVTRKSQ